METDARVRIAKEFHWEMGHRLRFHEGGCRNIHGHSYHMTVELEGTLDNNGMVLDYFDLKEIVDPFVEEIDHSFLCDAEDSVMLDLLVANGLKHVVVPFHTTAENIAAWLLGRVAERLRSHANISRITVRLRETERVYAETSAAVA